MTDLPISLLRTFVIVSDTLNLTAAAKQLHKAPSTVSMQLNRLEALVTITLLERGQHGVKLTAAGEQLRSHAHQLLALHDRILGTFLNAGIKGEVRLGTHDHYVTQSLTSLLQTYALSYPEVRLEVVCDHRPHYLASLVADGELDIALVDMSSLSDIGLRIGHDQLVWVKAEAHPLQLSAPIPLALFPEGSVDREEALRLLKQYNLPHRIAFTSHSRTSILAAVRAGIGIGVVPKTMLESGMITIGEELPILPQTEIRLIVAANINEASARLVSTIKQSLLQPQSGSH
ncbi:LysR family transcriptional regulator [Marinobacterium zhoushanense]|uniref:LysR family transcriptional regulator n=1 Tax=Marinobacterium zhoushanense TaxID=1679163 RepID=A0ABQ1JXQ7_9GAMM|nr:LysR family transcriptional regulator [Marinobacterium zhoushanense]GGB81580.1 LysR family transcriptional regulator [Marinobacterium zhoushanense]